MSFTCACIHHQLNNQVTDSGLTETNLSHMTSGQEYGNCAPRDDCASIEPYNVTWCQMVKQCRAPCPLWVQTWIVTRRQRMRFTMPVIAQTSKVTKVSIRANADGSRRVAWDNVYEDGNSKSTVQRLFRFRCLVTLSRKLYAQGNFVQAVAVETIDILCEESLVATGCCWEG